MTSARPRSLNRGTSKSPSRQPLYQGLSSEDKCHISLEYAFSHNIQLKTRYSVHNVVGFGTNGCVLAARDLSRPETFSAVAIKIIYKPRAGKLNQISSEVQALKTFADMGSKSFILQYLDEWQDSCHFYLVTELYGSDWMSFAAPEERPAGTNYRPITVHGTTYTVHSGTSDLWAWSYVHRLHLFKTEGHTLLAFQPIQSVIKQVATALALIHSRSFYHGDVKIENIIIQSTARLGAVVAEGAEVRLADFGHTKYVYYGIKAYGTRAVSPPELLSDSPFDCKELDGRAADVFALGMCLFSLLNKDCRLPDRVTQSCYADLVQANQGRFPFEGIPDLGEDGWDLLNGMCRVDPGGRMTIQQVLAHPWLSAEL
ncbi:kinase-like domain-containing protein [Chytriomyces sp. MP71]|nr:kinase-like domain-containing protein [Chytriomyces sp. MP71]